jgi:hypothetical protein
MIMLPQVGEAALTTVLAVIPVFIRLYIPARWSNEAVIRYVAAVFFGAIVAFKPDRRFALTRTPTLNIQSDNLFPSDSTDSAKRTAFRVHIF